MLFVLLLCPLLLQILQSITAGSVMRQHNEMLSCDAYTHSMGYYSGPHKGNRVRQRPTCQQCHRTLPRQRGCKLQVVLAGRRGKKHSPTELESANDKQELWYFCGRVDATQAHRIRSPLNFTPQYTRYSSIHRCSQTHCSHDAC